MKKIYSLLLFCILYPAPGFASPHENTYDNNDRCTNAAEREFEREWGDGMLPNKGSLTIATYNTHYNADLNKCFMLVKIRTSNTKSGSASVHSFVLIDVYEGIEFGSYGERAGKFIGKSRETSNCEVNQVKCSSKEEFLQQVQIYMGP